MNYRIRLALATALIFVVMLVTGIAITLNGGITIIGTAIAAVFVAFFCVRKNQL